MIWDFLQRYDDSWIWRCNDRHTVSESSRNFAALEECVADAALHGYTAQGRGHEGGAKRSRPKRGAPATSR